MIADLILDALKKSQAASYQTPSSGGMPAAKQSMDDPKLRKGEEEDEEEEEDEDDLSKGEDEDEKPLTRAAAKELFKAMFQEQIASLNKSVTSAEVSGEDTDQTLKGAENA